MMSFPNSSKYEKFHFKTPSSNLHQNKKFRQVEPVQAKAHPLVLPLELPFATYYAVFLYNSNSCLL